MYQIINTIVEKGQAERVIDAAVSAGSRGGTIINGRGSSIHETARLFGMTIEPEKEIVLILAPVEDVKRIVDTIYEEMDLQAPGNGVVFVQDLARVRGLYAG